LKGVSVLDTFNRSAKTWLFWTLFGALVIAFVMLWFNASNASVQAELLLVLVIGAEGLFAYVHLDQEKTTSFYLKWYEAITDHNWNLLAHKDVFKKVDPSAVLCFSQLNLLLLAWIHWDIMVRDGFAPGLKAWLRRHVESNDLPYREKYTEILDRGDIYPPDFVKWLRENMELPAKANLATPEQEG